MRFGHQLRTSLIRDYSAYYIDYDGLKDSLKTPVKEPIGKSDGKARARVWNEDYEQRFIRQLEQELDKVFNFQNVKSEEISRRVAASEREVSDVIARARAANDATSSKPAGDPPSEEDYVLLEEDLSDIIADVHDLAKFTQLNYTGFQKIIKKHDKMTSWHLRPVFQTRLSAKPFWKEDSSALIVDLSRLYDSVRTRGDPVKGDSAAGGGQQNFVRQTTKYWVHKDNITELKLIILKHLPVLVFNASKEFESKDCAISSIYYDNPHTWELYKGRLKKTEGAEAIRLRWYGGMETDTIFVERKTHREDWTGEKSVKARFSLKEKNVNDFLSGRLPAHEVFKKMRKEGKKSEEEITNLEQLAKEVQFRVITRGLVPVTRSFYNRTAFQLPGDARVRISLDTELTMTREDNEDGRERCGANWRRMDIGIDFPFSQLPPEDVERFPYAVLEVKLQTQAGQEPPRWIRDLCASHLVEAVPKYSKFIHGTATLNPGKIKLLPFWLPQMDTDIRKPISHYFGIMHPNQSTDASTSALDDDASDDDEDLIPRFEDTNGSEDENLKRLRIAREAMQLHDTQQRQFMRNNADSPNAMDIEERVAAQQAGSDFYKTDEDPFFNEDDYPIYESDDDINDLEEAKRVGGWTYYRLWAWYHLQHAPTSIWNAMRGLAPVPRATPIPGPQAAMGVPKGSTMRKRFHAPAGKRIHVPVRVEPKVFFAAERTFLAWLEFSVILGSIAATLLNFGDDLAILSGAAFTLVAIFSLMYSLGLYVWRVRKIRGRRAVAYHDWLGPSILCIGLLTSVAVSFGLRLSRSGDGGLKDGHGK